MRDKPFLPYSQLILLEAGQSVGSKAVREKHVQPFPLSYLSTVKLDIFGPGQRAVRCRAVLGVHVALPSCSLSGGSPLKPHRLR